MNEAEVRGQVVAASRKMYARGMVSGSGGNISARYQDTILITPTGYSLADLKPEELVQVDLSGNVIGPGKPSKEIVMHLACYQDRPEVAAVVHVHSTYSVAVACRKDLDYACTMPVYTGGYAARTGQLPAVLYLKSGSPELAAAVREVIKNRNSVLLANHGVVTVGKDMQAAVNLAEEVEQNAMLYMLLGDRGRAIQ